VAKLQRFEEQYNLSFDDAAVLVTEIETADYFERAVAADRRVSPASVANWVRGELFSLMNQAGAGIGEIRVTPEALADLAYRVEGGEVNNNTAKAVLAEMVETGRSAEAIISARGLQQISETDEIARLVRQVLEENPEQVALFLGGKTTVLNWLFGQVMGKAGGRANPQVVRAELEKQLEGDAR
jgi:aspartyl-tRNA(Asn)/glutamyl-tRNA(Gln) amidotransferase subunit B